MTLLSIFKKLACFLSIIASVNLWANDLFSQEDEFLTAEEAYQSVISIDQDKLYVEWIAKPGYYLYQHQFKTTAQNSDSKEKLTQEFAPGKEKFDEYFQKDLVVYYGSTEVTSALPKISPPYELVVKSQACADAGLCYPPRKQFFFVDSDYSVIEKEKTSFSSNNQNSASMTASEEKSLPAAETEDAFLPFILLGALLGGLILNLMPCVFPVLSLKALSFASSNMSAQSQHVHGWAYTAGVIGSFVLAAVVILVGREAGEALGWGFQLQHPVFVAFMVYLFFIMGLSLSGLVEIGTQWMGAGQSLTSGHGLSSSFFTGVLAAVVASPCTAPFMASALGFALTQPMYIAILVFITLGFGMALPFLLLSYIPSLAKLLPAPGAWMDTLKQFLAFPLYATCVWLLWVLGHQASSDAAALIVLGGVLIAFALWLLKLRTKTSTSKWLTRGVASVSMIAAATFAYDIQQVKPGAHEQWEAYTPARLEELRQDGKPVFLDLTADWCITCKVNERVALNTKSVIESAEENGIVMMQGDWTNSDPEISKLLEKFGRSGVPLYLMYPANKNAQPEVLPQLLTESMVLDAMERAL